ncbi:ArnT family glycosyltransferase [Tuwongella immobilis]|uniref:Glycosyltransferase RgtA/B/C/D-like domain-containing protein n=1 Tax=Tuwongella immobilis TaxID=692036 RepID=A0A6C2YLB2_9BACT|nr:glycosyltransferase family 39 protein [Tuwongella immobilis]VIP02360.1 Glycosyl transferase family 39 OS=Pirellula staleyi (strain ATCC 27377 / DSM 6068 / ICPB 4128) GN=Psta_3676 PE=4 SV=1: PMT_2 [Tuwongella immobilis]VTS01166.1 Glycosyl transferase family 39 OS=Pirellula staleyi (strain ATCC 27377 / DSM 6068 / ICPB 4128) GN=Psta_3676 PE=4 SV=1: PMT_2 [Tuwongella immobilis]
MIRGLALVGLFAAVLFFPRLGEQDCWPSHEARAAQNATSLLTRGDWLLPTMFDGTPEYQKPPADYWMIAALATLTGGEVTPWTVRAPSAIAAMLTVLAITGSLMLVGRPGAGIAAGIILATAIRFTTYARVGRIDMPLAGAITLGLLAIFCGWHLRRFWLAAIVAGIAFGWAILLKGPIGLALPIATLLGIALVEWRRPPIGPCLLGLLTIAIVAVPWFVAVHVRTNGEFTQTFFWYHNFQRAMGGAEALAAHPVWFYPIRWIVDFLPWSILLLAIAVQRLRHGTASMDRFAVWGIVWLVAMMLVLSASRFKRAEYLLPAYPGAAIALGCAMESLLLRWSIPRRRTVAFGLLAVAALGWWGYDRWLLPPQAAPREMRAFAQRIRERDIAAHSEPSPVILFQTEAHLLAWHLRPPVETITDWQMLTTRLHELPTAWVVLHPANVDEFRQRFPDRATTVPIDLAETLTVPPARPLLAIPSN